MDTKNFTETNRSNWNERVRIHAEPHSGFYDVEGFLAGQSSLKEIEIAELGDVSGKTMLHAMCHFGLDTLSWVRRGAEVTGVDFSQEAIATARDLAKKANLHADFLCSDILELPSSLSGKFDIVFASYGILCWLPDINRFVESLTGCLKPGGVFCLVNGHPFIDMFEYDEEKDQLVLQLPYFHRSEPEECVSHTSYTNKERTLQSEKTYQWNHDLSSILTAVEKNGLELLSFQEYPFGFYQKFPNQVQNEKGQWVFADDKIEIPLLMSVKARKKE
jgi:SAM-dependent methyltransferase